jgi:hypothetical protein
MSIIFVTNYLVRIVKRALLLSSRKYKDRKKVNINTHFNGNALAVGDQ